MPKTKSPLISIQDLSKSFGTLPVLTDISLDIREGEFFTLLGPSGCGKTTLLRLLSGFETPDSGEIYINDACVNDLPPQARHVHTIFQSYALFPHLSVYENVAFALRCKKTPQATINKRVKEALQLVQLEGFEQRNVTTLSGGQQQRVAIARAIINRPQVLLLDEPFSSLDYRLRKTMQRDLKQLQQTLNITFIFVTHDQEEALSMSDRIAVFNHGTIEQIGTPRDIYETPVNLYTARFIGETNVFDITIEAVQNDTFTTHIENITLHCKNEQGFNANDACHLIVRPEDLRVWKPKEVTDTKDMLPGTVSGITYKGSTVDLMVKLSSGKIIHATEFFDEDDEDLEYEIGEKVWVHWLSGWEVLLPYEN